MIDWISTHMYNVVEDVMMMLRLMLKGDILTLAHRAKIYSTFNICGRKLGGELK